jgi:acyl-CoA thioester hydrolase
MDPVYQYSHCVTQDEIDQQQHVHNLRYLQWTLWAAHAHSAAAGWDSAVALRGGVGWVVRSHDITYRSAAFAGDEFIIQTWVSELHASTLRRRYVICRPADKQVLARVQTRWVLADLRVRKAMEVSAAIASQIRVLKTPPPLPW